MTPVERVAYEFGRRFGLALAEFGKRLGTIMRGKPDPRYGLMTDHMVHCCTCSTDVASGRDAIEHAIAHCRRREAANYRFIRPDGTLEPPTKIIVDEIHDWTGP